MIAPSPPPWVLAGSLPFKRGGEASPPIWPMRVWLRASPRWCSQLGPETAVTEKCSRFAGDGGPAGEAGCGDSAKAGRDGPQEKAVKEIKIAVARNARRLPHLRDGVESRSLMVSSIEASKSLAQSYPRRKLRG